MNETLTAIWMTACGVFVLFIWWTVFIILRRRRKFLYIRVLGSRGAGMQGVKLYGYRYAQVYYRTLAGSYGGDNVYAVEKEGYVKKSLLGVTDRDGYLRGTFWLRNYFSLRFETRDGVALDRRADTLLLSDEAPDKPMLVYL
jgi:hypothetical protein